MFKDLLSKMEGQQNIGKWHLNGDENRSVFAFKDSIEPDGHRFRVVLNAMSTTFIRAYAYVIGGETVANGYRVEMRLHSSEEEFTITYHGPVFPVDVTQPWNQKESFWIAKEKFKIFNKGFEDFGDHNQDKNGEVTFPVMVKIIKKELNIPKKDSDTLEDADMETEEK